MTHWSTWARPLVDTRARVPPGGSQAHDTGGAGGVRDERRNHVRGADSDAAQGVGGERALELQTEVDQTRMRGGDPAGVAWQAVRVERSQAAQVADAG